MTLIKKPQINDINNNSFKKSTREEIFQTEIKQKILKISNEITFTLVKLQKCSQRINDIALNKKHLDIENEYIDSLGKEMKEIGIKDDNQKKMLVEMKEKNRIFKEVNRNHISISHKKFNIFFINFFGF